MNSIIHFIEYLPFAVTKNISVSNFEMIMLYIFFITLIYFLVTKKTTVLKFILLIGIIIEISYCFDKYHTLNQNKFIVYNIKQASAFDFICGTENTFLGSTNLINDENKLNMYIQGNWIDLGIIKSSKFDLFDKNDNTQIKQTYVIKRNQFIQFKKKRIVLIDNENCYETAPKTLPVDYLVLTGNADINVSEITQQYKSNLIIMDASNSLWRIKKWIKECDDKKINYYNIMDGCAFISDL